YSHNLMTIQTFTQPGEKSWQLRYDYDFASLGVPGLSFMTRYTRGDDIRRGAGLEDGHEYERDTDLAYTLQDGPLKGLSLRWRNVTARSSHGADMDENRLIANYSIPIW
ncbi:OprD family outer membrane porin, partial [Pseudomonas citronellolis]